PGHGCAAQRSAEAAARPASLHSEHEHVCILTQAAPSPELSLLHLAQAHVVGGPPKLGELPAVGVGHPDVVLGAELAVRAGGDQFVEIELCLTRRVVALLVELG